MLAPAGPSSGQGQAWAKHAWRKLELGMVKLGQPPVARAGPAMEDWKQHMLHNIAAALKGRFDFFAQKLFL